jgi:hypothetical protein
MLPTFFEDPRASSGHIILANFGERESWGQKVLSLNEGFTDLGFLDVAYPEHMQEDDTSYCRHNPKPPLTHSFM